jgi:activator of HSP90 ATPase
MKDYTGSFRINAMAEDVYACLTNPHTIELWSGSPAVMPEEPGGEFSWFDGDITGTIVKLIPNRIVEQEWFFGKKYQPSLVIIKLRESGGVTEIKIVQTGIPDEDYENISAGWEEYVIEGIATFLNPNF